MRRNSPPGNFVNDGAAEAVKTSAGTIGLLPTEREILERLVAGTASLEDGQQFYAGIVARGSAFPIEWELYVLRATVAALPARNDLVARLGVVEECVGTERPDYDLTIRLGFERAWARFSALNLLHGESERRRQLVNQAIDDACTLLASPIFDRQTAARRVEIITAVHNTLMSLPSADMPVVADLGLRRLKTLLTDPELTEPMLCAAFDALHSLYFAGVSDVRDLRRFDAIVPAVEAWLEERVGRNAAPTISWTDGRKLTVAYLLHTAHLSRGNAVSPLILSLAEMHAAHPNRRILLYFVQHVDQTLVDELSAKGLTVRGFPQDQRYDRLDEIAESLRADKVDVVITEQNRAVAAALFVRRVAPRQIWLDTGFPFWSLRALDWTLSPVMTPDAMTPVRMSPISWRQSAASLKSIVDPQKVAEVRAGFPADAFVLGVFARLIKLDRAYLEFLARLIKADPRFHLIIAGPGDARLVDDFAAREDIAGRVTYVAGSVDLNVYGPAIDAMCDTFPFIGGNACREVAVHGTPVIAKLGTPWDAILRNDRNPELLVETDAAYIAVARRLASDAVFRDRQRQVALMKAEEYVRPGRVVSDVEAAIAAAINWDDDDEKSSARVQTR